jgi:hypothetical protein
MRKVLLCWLVALAVLVGRSSMVQAGLLNWLTLPTLSSDQQEWTIYHRAGVFTGNCPVKVISDGYKMIRAYRTEARKSKGTEIPSKDMVEWGWKMTIKNEFDDDLEVSVEYTLQDKDSFMVTSGSISSLFPSVIKAGEPATLQGTSNMEYGEVERVVGRTWTLSCARVGHARSELIELLK